mmetsp:Transcript_5484/g.10051  ORF Transcript_5484/g.10051 Transcript_5484/m.10051 type:complete len:97 (-) Transcript_5484:32-322(-)
MKVIFVLALLTATLAFTVKDKLDEPMLMEVDLSGCSCNRSKLGNGLCEEECNSSSCNYDDGDCCSSCSNACVSKKGNGTCNSQCNTSCCEYDGGDC